MLSVGLNSRGDDDDDDDDMVRTDRGMSWNFKVTFSRPGEFWNQAYFLDSRGNVNSWCDKFFNDL